MKRKRKDGVMPEKRVKSNSREYADLVSVSVILYLLDKFADWVYGSLIQGFFGRVFTAYSVEERAFEQGFVKNYFKDSYLVRTYFRRCRGAISEGFENSFFLRKLRSLTLHFKHVSIRSYGNFWLMFGIYTVLVYFIKMLLPFFETDPNHVLITALIISVVSIPLLTTKETLAAAVGNSKMVGKLFVAAFGFREENFEAFPSHARHDNTVMIVLGMLCGVLTFFVHPLYIPLFAAIVLVLLLVFTTPEIGVLGILAGFPFLSYLSYPTISLALLVLATFLAYLIKVFRGKRILRMDFFDWMVLIFLLAIYFGGRISVGGEFSYQSALISCTLMLGYFLLVNLMRTKQWVHRCMVSLVSSATVVSAIGIGQYFFGVLNRSTLDLSYFSDIKGRVTSLFENPNVLGFYLVTIFPLALYFLVRAKGFKKRLGAFSVCTLMVVCVVLTWSRGAWLAMLISSAIFLTIYTRKTLRYLLLSVFAVPFLAFLLPDTVIRRFLSIGNFADSSTTYRLYTWRGTWDAICDFFVSGVGYGVETYQAVYPEYAYAGMASAEHSHNLILQILFSMGVFALLIFLFVVLLFVQRNLENIKLASDQTTRMMIAGALCGALALLLMGIFDYVWYEYRIFFLFWCIFGLASALARIDRNERERKQMLQIAEEDYASVDFEI